MRHFRIFSLIFSNISSSPGETTTGIAGAQTSEAQPFYSRAPGPKRGGIFRRVVDGSAPDRPGGIAEVFIHNVHNVWPLSFGLRRLKFETQVPKGFSHSEVNECSQSRRIAGCEIRYPEDYRHKRIIESQRKVQKIPNTCISF